MEDIVCEWIPEAFKATARQEGGDRIVEVTGEGQCPTPDFSVSLEPHPGGIVPRPEALALKLVERPPQGFVPQVITATPLKQEFRVSDAVTTVWIVNIGIEIPVE